MGDFYRCIDPILTEEGGYSNHPNDPGGQTQFGISKRAYPHLDLHALTLAQAVDLYQVDYWLPICGDDLPDGLDVLVFDSAVNQGPTTAIKLLQRVLNVKEDGICGSVTLNAAKNAMPIVLGDYCAERALRYEFSPQEIVFGRGWYRRLFRMYGLARSWTR